jgi:glycosyltransferase involved in cell wall biosynthesis
VSALVPYKRLEVAIEAAGRVGAHLRIVGTGPERDRLTRTAGPTVEFLGAVSDEALREHYRGAIALVLPAEEDFGMAPVEAMACGTPVLALARGGATESVTDGVTGVLVPEPTAEAFAQGMTRIQNSTFDPAMLRRTAEAFGVDRFEAGCRQLVADLLTSGAPC